MNEAQRLAEVQDALADMREDIRTKSPNDDRKAPAKYLLAALERRRLRVVSDDEWTEQYEAGTEHGESMRVPVTTDEQVLDEALVPPWP